VESVVPDGPPGSIGISRCADGDGPILDDKVRVTDIGGGAGGKQVERSVGGLIEVDAGAERTTNRVSAVFIENGKGIIESKSADITRAGGGRVRGRERHGRGLILLWDG